MLSKVRRLRHTAGIDEGRETIDALPPLALNAWLRWDVLRRVLAPVPRGSTVLEIGAGQGAVAARLARTFRYTGIEADEGSYTVASGRLGGTARIIKGQWEALPDNEYFDVVCAFEVLEHIEDDVGALEAWASRLRPGGLLVVSTPLHQHRFGPWDELVGHYRRYGREDLAALLAGAGMAGITVVTYGFPLGYVLEPARNIIARRRQRAASAEERTVEQRTAASGRALQPSRRSLGAGTRLASAPFRLLQRPFAQTELGTGVVAAGWRHT